MNTFTSDILSDAITIENYFYNIFKPQYKQNIQKINNNKYDIKKLNLKIGIDFIVNYIDGYLINLSNWQNKVNYTQQVCEEYFDMENINCPKEDIYDLVDEILKQQKNLFLEYCKNFHIDLSWRVSQVSCNYNTFCLVINVYDDYRIICYNINKNNKHVSIYEVASYISSHHG